VNGYEYVAEGVPVPFDAGDVERRRETFHRAADAIHERGLTLHHAMHFPEVDEGNAKLAGAPVDELPPAELAEHLEAAFKWHERSWTLHWCWGKNGPSDRFQAVFKEVTGNESREAMAELLTHEPNLLTEAIDLLMGLARIVQQQPALRQLFEAHSPEEVLVRYAAVPGAEEFGRALEELLEKQGLRCGAGFGTERSQCMPGWREDPTIVIALVQKYVPQNLDALLAARVEAIRRRDEKVAAIRSQITDSEKLASFDFWLAAARRGQQAFEDHNYKMDSASNSLLHRAITATARRLVVARAIENVADAWYLTRHELGLALRGISTAASGQVDEAVGADGEATPQDSGGSAGHWVQLIGVRRQLQAWQQTLTPPARLGAPPAPPPAAQPLAAPGAGEKPQPPADVLVTGQTGSAGVATGRVRLADHQALVPDVEEGDVLVARNAGPLWTPVFPTVAAVVLDEGVLFQHAMLTCREYGVPAVFQTKKATQTLREGQRVTVDATNGWVLPAAD
jgi:rifampicin phosphotransferase